MPNEHPNAVSLHLEFFNCKTLGMHERQIATNSSFAKLTGSTVYYCDKLDSEKREEVTVSHFI